MTASARDRVAVDAMGGDAAPREVVVGAAMAALDERCDVVLVGPQAIVEAEIGQIEGAPSAARAHLSVVDASEVIAMDEHPANAVRQKPDASVVRACRLVAQGDAAAVVSAGNSGAILAAALLVVKRIDGVARPAIGTLFPTRSGQTFVLDVGASVDAKPHWLLQYAVMGDVYARTVLGVEHPRIGLLSNGEEPSKGTALVQQAHELLTSAPLHFVGNVEGKELFRGACDVLVCDGFAGNVLLKAAEGVGEYLFATLREVAHTTPRAKLGGMLLRPSLQAIRDRVDYRHTGGALLLGVNGEVVIAHGRSDALAIRNAIRVALKAVRADVSGLIRQQRQLLRAPSAAAATT